MTTTDDSDGAQRAVMQKTSHALAAATARLRTLGLHDVDVQGDGRSIAAGVSAQHRRELLVYLSELEETVKQLEVFAADIASEIAGRDRNRNAAAAYQKTGVTYRDFRRKCRH